MNSASPAAAELLLRIGDDALILGHRLSEWCGHAPTLEEDVALANIGLDCIGQAQLLLNEAGSRLTPQQDGDQLAFHRDVIDFRNLLLVELPNIDFGVTIMRQFLVDAFRMLHFEALAKSMDQAIAAIAVKAKKEVEYHLRHSASWVIRLGDGTEESARRSRNAVDYLWPYTGELFLVDHAEESLAGAGVGPRRTDLEPAWLTIVGDVFQKATLQIPAPHPAPITGGWTGRHTEYLGRLLAEMQVLPRTHPGASW